MDWNGDGLDDLIIGERYGKVHYFRRTGTGVHDLTDQGVLMASGDTISVSYNSAPLIVDWNNDGLQDLLLGSQTKALRLYLNSGTAENPVLTSYTKIQSGGVNISPYALNPNICDFNNDGKKDLLISCYPGYDNQIRYYENVGTDANPVFNGSIEIANVAGDPVFPGSYPQVVACDWNWDGLPDMMASNGSGIVYVSYAVGTGTSEEESSPVVTGFNIYAAVNPVRDDFIIRIHNPGESVEITVYDLTGHSIETKTIDAPGSGDAVVIDTSSIPAGVYCIVASDGNSTSACRVILID